LPNVVPHRPDRRHQHLLDGGADQEPVGQVVDVLAGQPEVDPRGGIRRAVGQALADEVLDGLDVVVGRRQVTVALGLDPLYELGVPAVELPVGIPEGLALPVVEFEGDRRQVRKGKQVLHLDPDPRPHQGGLAGVLPQRFRPGSVPAVQGRHGIEGVGHARGSPGREQKRVESWPPRATVPGGAARDRERPVVGAVRRSLDVADGCSNLYRSEVEGGKGR